MSPESNDTLEEQVAASPDRCYEDAIRFIRQRLIALEEGRDEDAETLKKFILSEFGVEIADTHVDNVPNDMLDRWVSGYGFPDPRQGSSVRLVTVNRTFTNEPIWRIPADLDTRAPGPLETPLHVLIAATTLPWDDYDAWSEDIPAHLRPRHKTGGGDVSKLPKAVQEACRFWQPTPAEES
jgi:hypothetical protein